MGDIISPALDPEEWEVLRSMKLLLDTRRLALGFLRAAEAAR